MKAVKGKGFTLIEVCLVMLVFGVAVSSLMALFPVSLRQGTQAVSDSVVSTFGDSVMNSLAGKASSMQTDENGKSCWEKKWKPGKNEDPAATFKKALGKIEIGSSGLVVDCNSGAEHTAEEYLGLANVNIRYKLEIAQVTQPEKYGGRLYRAILHATDNPSINLDNGTVFVTYLPYLGSVP